LSTITKSEWQDWKQNNVTRSFLAAVDMRVEDAKDILSVSAGQEPDQDNYFRGFIAAYREMLEFRVDDLVDD